MKLEIIVILCWIVVLSFLGILVHKYMIDRNLNNQSAIEIVARPYEEQIAIPVTREVRFPYPSREAVTLAA